MEGRRGQQQGFRRIQVQNNGENADELLEKIRETNEMSGPVFKLKNDPRITPVGKWLRKYSLDEFAAVVERFKKVT